MTRFDLGQEFDCVTSWFDSLNYLLHVEELAAAFKQVAAHLAPGGYFLFAMNTLYGITVQWQRFPYYLQQETADYIEFAENTCDYENSIATMRLIMFERDGKPGGILRRATGSAATRSMTYCSCWGCRPDHPACHRRPAPDEPLGSQDGRV